MISLLPEESLTRLKQRFKSEFQQFTALEIQALVTADIEGFVDNARMRQMTSAHPTDITKILQILVSKGMIVRDGQGRWSRYRLAPTSVHMPPTSVHMSPTSVHMAELSEAEIEEIYKIAEAAKQSKRLTYSEMESILIRLCRGRWLTRKYLAALLGRNQDALRIRFLSPMVKNNLLSLRYPEIPNHEDQAYTNRISYVDD